MSRYFTRPAISRLYVEDRRFDEEHPLIPSLSVADHVSADTGILDANGDPIWRSCRPVGFGRDNEW